MTDNRPVFRVRYLWQTPNGQQREAEHVCRGFDAVEVRGILTQRSDVLRIISVEPYEALA